MTTRLGAFGLVAAIAPVVCIVACNPAPGPARPAPSETPAQTAHGIAPERGNPATPSQPDQPAPAASGDRALRVIEAGELIDSAMRKLNKDDGAGCLADLDRARALDSKTEARAAMTRAMCEMAAGKCQTGKQRAEAWYSDNSRLTPDLVARSVEGVASMYCRGGDMNPRDQMLQSVFELSQGAYTSTRDPAYCSARIATIRKLSPQVSPRDDRDEQIKSAFLVSCTAGSTCLGRAGDCAAAWKNFQQPDCPVAKGIANIADPAVRNKALADSFESIVTDCKGKPR